MSPKTIVVGAGTAGTSLAISLARQGREVILIEKNLAPQDRIVGELLQPGGMRALEKLGIAECATEDCDSIRVDGYTIILPPGISSERPDGAEIVLNYPDHDPESAYQKFGVNQSSNCSTSKKCSPPRGRSFHNGNFVSRMRQVAAKEPNITIVEGTVIRLLEENNKVVGVCYKSAATSDSETSNRETYNIYAPFTVIADGIWSGLRTCTNLNKPVLISSFIGVIVKHAPMEAPVPHRHCGHVVLAQPSPILIYQISPTETRVLVDVRGRVPSSATGELSKFLRGQAQWLPDVFRESYLEAIVDGDIKSMPNRALQSSSLAREGSVLIGDALNMRHPLTGGGMTVALKDVALLSDLLVGLDLGDTRSVQLAVRSFHERRISHAATINVLANALYSVFTTPISDDDADAGTISARCHLQDSCFDYLSLGGVYAAGPIGLLSGLTPSPTILAIHFFMVAFYGVKNHLLPFGFLNPSKLLRVYRLILVACGIIMPLLELERSTFLSWFPIRKTVQLFFPWEHMRWNSN